MVGTRRRQEAAEAVPAQQLDSDSDDEAPEEVTLAVGKQSAEQRRREEAEAKAAARAAAKERRAAAAGRRAAAAAEQQAAGGSEDDDAVAGDEAEEEEYEEEEDADEEGLDLLPDEVLAALASNKRTQPTAEQKRLISEQLRAQREPGQPLAVLGSQRREISEVEAGPVVVRVLRPDQPTQASQSARDFLQQRLMGGVKRSADMLKPVRALQPAHVAQRQAKHVAALHAQRQQSKQAAVAAAGGGGPPQAKRRR